MTSMAESARPWRCFWAIPLPDNLRASLSSFVVRMRAAPGVEEDWRFTDADAWHLTLAFLGGIPQETVEPMVARIAAAVDGTAPFEVEAGSLGGFSGRRARVLWYGVTDDGKRLRGLAATVRAAAGLAPEEAGPYRPHVTLARSRVRFGAPLPRPGEDPPVGRVPVDEIVLFRSHLWHGPARYEALARIPLGATVAAGAAR